VSNDYEEKAGACERDPVAFEVRIKTMAAVAQSLRTRILRVLVALEGDMPTLEQEPKCTPRSGLLGALDSIMDTLQTVEGHMGDIEKLV